MHWHFVFENTRQNMHIDLIKESIRQELKDTLGRYYKTSRTKNSHKLAFYNLLCTV